KLTIDIKEALQKFLPHGHLVQLIENQDGFFSRGFLNKSSCLHNRFAALCQNFSMRQIIPIKISEQLSFMIGSFGSSGLADLSWPHQKEHLPQFVEMVADRRIVDSLLLLSHTTILTSI